MSSASGTADSILHRFIETWLSDGLVEIAHRHEVQATKKSWWIRAFATSSRTTGSGKLGGVLLRACLVTSLDDSNPSIKLIKVSTPEA